MAQSLEDHGIQVHGYTTQAFVWSTANNWDTTNSTSGSPEWTEAVLNVSATPVPKLRIGVQERFFLLGSLDDTIALDWAQLDYKMDEKLGFRAGKVKTPIGLLNESQDIDPAQVWILLPQSLYAIANRNSTMAHFGGVVYGRLPLSETFGEIKYRTYGGERHLTDDDAVFQVIRDKGIALPNGVSGPMYGGTIEWSGLLHGLLLGVSVDSEHTSGKATLASYTGTFRGTHFYQPYFYGKYENRKFMVASEYTRQALQKSTSFLGGPALFVPKDQRAWYAMTTYAFPKNLLAGIYYSSSFDRQLPSSSARYQKDWALSARYDINSFMYLKVEEHFVDGTEIGYSMSDNTAGLKPDSRMTLLKIGASF